MTPKEVRQLLYSAAKVVPPTFKGREMSARQKIDALEDHLFSIANWRGQLEEARLLMHDARLKLEDEWDQIEGWQAVVEGKTKQAVVQAKRTVRPDLYDGIREGKFLIERLSDQIRRLERDEEYAVSRGYTFIAG